VLEDFEHGQNDVGAGAEDSERLLCAATEHAVDSAEAKAVHEILRQPKWDGLGDGESFALGRGR
jgi:hypothetical protein